MENHFPGYIQSFRGKIKKITMYGYLCRPGELAPPTTLWEIRKIFASSILNI